MDFLEQKVSLKDPVPLMWVALLAFALGGGLLIASAYGAKWFLMIFMAYFAAAIAVFFKDIRVFGAWLLYACAPIGIQYQLWTHDKKNVIIDHFGGNPPEPVINLVDFPIYFLAFVWLTDLAVSKRKLPTWQKFDTWVLLFLGYSLLSLTNLSSSETSDLYLYLFEVLRYAKYYLLYWVLRTYCASPASLYGFFGIGLLVLILQGLVACLQYFLYFQLPIAVGGVASTQFLEMSGEMIQRVTGFLGHANTFAAYLIIPLTCAMIALVSRLSLWLKAVILPIFLFGVLTIILTFSRNGWLTLAICGCIIMLLSVKKGNISGNLIVFSVAFILFALGLFYGLGMGTALGGLLGGSGSGSTDVFNAIYIRVFEDEGKAFESRWDLLGIAGRMIADHPLVGIGLNTYEENMRHYDINGTLNVIQQPVHNVYALVAAESGIPAAALYVLLGWILVKMSYTLTRSTDERFWAVGNLGLCTFIGLGFANLFDVSLRKEPVLGLVVIISAFIVTYSSELSTAVTNSGGQSKEIEPVLRPVLDDRCT